jgi:hypothetical protein
MTTEILFVGYLTLEEWLRSVDKQRPVYALLFTEVGETSFDLRTDSIVIEVAQPEDGQALVHYARLYAGSLRYQGGEPFDRITRSGWRGPRSCGERWRVGSRRRGWPCGMGGWRCRRGSRRCGRGRGLGGRMRREKGKVKQ